MINKKLGKGTDFDLAVYNAQDDANEYADDNHVIGRNTSILVARKPAAKPGKGTAQKYLNMAPAAIAAMANGPLSYGARPMMPIVRPVRPPTDQPAADDIALMFKQQDQHWQKTQDSMAA